MKLNDRFEREDFHCRLTDRDVTVQNRYRHAGYIGTPTIQWVFTGGKCQYSNECLLQGIDCIYVPTIGGEDPH